MGTRAGQFTGYQGKGGDGFLEEVSVGAIRTLAIAQRGGVKLLEKEKLKAVLKAWSQASRSQASTGQVIRLGGVARRALGHLGILTWRVTLSDFLFVLKGLG